MSGLEYGMNINAAVAWGDLFQVILDAALRKRWKVKFEEAVQLVLSIIPVICCITASTVFFVSQLKNPLMTQYNEI